MEILRKKKRNALVAAAMSIVTVTGCTIDSYLTDPSNVHCDGRRTKAYLADNGMATFIVHGKHKGDVATVQIRRDNQDASLKVSGDVTGPPQQLESDGYTAPVPVLNGVELSAFGAGGAWVIDVRKGSVVIQGSCEGM